MRIVTFAPLTLLVLSACATGSMSTAALPESGYTPGALGFNAIMDSDWKRAEQMLAASSAAETDPARLLNLAHVYRKTGRELAAKKLYEAVLAERDMTLELASGEAASAHELAQRALARPTGVAALR
ncbi:MAG: hypothetical protein Q7J32_14765 [Sphingomonadaceae bacterium]|nr:hypothetical protein [Sphingomonadaceae bacterium]